MAQPNDGERARGEAADDPRSLQAILLARRESLVEAWTRKVLQDDRVPEANRLSEPALHDHIPGLVDRIIRSLDQTGRQAGDGEATGREIGGDVRSRLHAWTRFHQRFSLASAMRELSHLRSTFVELCYAEGAHVRGEEAELLHAAIDEAMSTVAVEMEQAARSELEEEARFRERFIGIVGHDLRSPLGAITFASAVLMQQDECSEAQSRVVRRISRSADRMARMIKDLLDFTRSRQGGGMPLTRAPTDLRAVCRQVVEEAQIANPQRVVRFAAQGDALGAWDADRLAQVASNLIGNALEHGAADGPVQVRLRDTGAGSVVVLEVHNDGPPIPPELLPRLFDPFRRSAGSDEGAATGLGLGLFIVHQIVTAHGGTIRVTSDVAQGTTFTVELPRSR